MSITKLSVLNVNDMLPEDILSDATKLKNNIIEKADPKTSEALLINDTIIIIGNKNVTEHSKVYITNPRIYKDYSHGFDSDMKKEISIIKKELDLNQKEMKELLKFHKAEKRRLEGEKEDLLTRLIKIEKKAKEIKGASIEKGLIGKMEKKNIEFNLVMDEIILNRVCFTGEAMEEVACISKCLIKDVQNFLELTREL